VQRSSPAASSAGYFILSYSDPIPQSQEKNTHTHTYGRDVNRRTYPQPKGTRTLVYAQMTAYVCADVSVGGSQRFMSRTRKAYPHQQLSRSRPNLKKKEEKGVNERRANGDPERGIASSVSTNEASYGKRSLSLQPEN